MTLIKLGRIFFNRWIKKNIKEQFEYDLHPIVALDLGPARNVIYDYINFIFILSIFFRWDYYVLEFMLSVAEFILSGLQVYVDSTLYPLKKIEYKYKRLEFFEEWQFPIQIFNELIPLKMYTEYTISDVMYFLWPFLGFYTYYACSDSLGFVNYFGTTELEQANNKTLFLYYLERILYSSDIVQILRYWDDISLVELSDISLISLYLFEIPGLQNITLFRDYREAQPLEDIVALNWFYKPTDLAFTMFQFGGSLVGFYVLFVYLDAGFAALTVLGSALVLDFSSNFLDIFRYLSTVSEYRKLFYKQIVFLPKAVQEVAGTPSFLLKGLKKEIKNFRNYYEEKVSAGKSFVKSTNTLQDFNIDFNFTQNEIWKNTSFSRYLSFLLKKCTVLNLTENQKIQLFKDANLLPFDFKKKENQTIIDDQILFFSYNYAFSGSNDPEVVNREFQSKEFKNQLLTSVNLPEIKEEQHQVLKEMFTPEGIFTKTKIEEFDKFFGKEFVDEILKNSKTFEENEYETFVENRKNEKKKKKEENRKNLYKTLNLKFNIEQEQFLIDYLISLIPSFTIFFQILMKTLLNNTYRVLNFIFLLLVSFCKMFWKNCRFFFFFFYRAFFLLLQSIYSFPLIVFLFFFKSFISSEKEKNLRIFFFKSNSFLNYYYIQILRNIRKNYTLPDFNFVSLSDFFFFIKKLYFFIRLKILQLITQERYEDIFEWMADPEIRAEVISEILAHQKDLGYAPQEGDDRYWDDPRILSLEGYSYIIDFTLGQVFGPVCLAAGGALFQYLIYSTMAAYPYIPWLETEYEGFLNYYGIYHGLLVTTISAGDWSFFDTWFDSVPYMSIHIERLYKEEFFAENINNNFQNEQENSQQFFADDLLFWDSEIQEFGFRAHIQTSDPITKLENRALKYYQNSYGKPAQFFELPYESMPKFVKRRKLNEYTIFLSPDKNRYDGYTSRRARFRSYARHNLIMTEYFERPSDPNEKFWHLNTKLKRLYKDFRNFGYRIFLSKDGYLDQYYRFDLYAGEDPESLQDLKPYDVLMFEVKQAYHDFHVLNYPIFAKHYYHDFFDEEWREDGNEDTLDELDNGQYIFDNYHRIFFENTYTIFKLDLEYFILRSWAKLKLEIISMHFYLQPILQNILLVKFKFKTLFIFLKTKIFN